MNEFDVLKNTTGMGITLNPDSEDKFDGWYLIDNKILLYYNDELHKPFCIKGKDYFFRKPYILSSNNEDIVNVYDDCAMLIIPENGFRKPIEIRNYTENLFIILDNENHSVVLYEGQYCPRKLYVNEKRNNFIQSNTFGDSIKFSKSIKQDDNFITGILNTSMIGVYDSYNSLGWVEKLKNIYELIFQREILIKDENGSYKTRFDIHRFSEELFVDGLKKEYLYHYSIKDNEIIFNFSFQPNTDSLVSIKYINNN